MTQDKRQDLSQRWITWAGHMDGLPICAGIWARDGSSIPEKIKDWVVTAGHLGRDGFIWSRKALGMGNQCPVEDG